MDFNTADPLIRWDSYENLSADGEGESCYLAISSWRTEPRTSSRIENLLAACLEAVKSPHHCESEGTCENQAW